MRPVTLYVARVEHGGHYFEAVDIMPSLARCRLFLHIEGFIRSSSTANNLADRASIREIRSGTVKRGDL